jgi:hypothetical protein
MFKVDPNSAWGFLTLNPDSAIGGRSEVESWSGEDVRLLNFKAVLLQGTLVSGKYQGFIKARRSIAT